MPEPEQPWSRRAASRQGGRQGPSQAASLRVCSRLLILQPSLARDGAPQHGWPLLLVIPTYLLTYIPTCFVVSCSFKAYLGPNMICILLYFHSLLLSDLLPPAYCFKYY